MLEKLKALNDIDELPEEIAESICECFSSGSKEYNHNIKTKDGLTINKVKITDSRGLDREGLCHEVDGYIIVNGVEFNFSLKLVDGPIVVRHFELDEDSLVVAGFKHKCHCKWEIVRKDGCQCGGN